MPQGVFLSVLIHTIVSWQSKRDRYGGGMFRKLLLLGVAAAIVIAFRNAVANKGGSYDPADH